MNAQNLRLSDAERSEVADRLGQHFADGRLDQPEYDERISRAMAAKTRADLEGLFDDLPGSQDLPGWAGAGSGWAGQGGGRGLPGAGAPADTGTARPPWARRRRGPVRMFLMVVMVLVVLSVAGHIAAEVAGWVFAPWWILMVILAIVAFRVLGGRSRTR